MIGRTVGNYVISAKVGEGGMGVVYRAEHPQISRAVAIKLLHPGADRDPELVHRFFNEARAATQIRNEHVVEVLDFGELPEHTPYLVMEWLEGQSLGSLLRAETKLPVTRASHILRGIVRALKAAHAKGVVHRDLKPDNVFLVRRDAETELVKVLDFGIAKMLTGPAPQYQTQTGAIIGTPAYMSPEQCRGAKEIDARTDIYSLGVIGYQMLTGYLPFGATAIGELLFLQLTEKPPALATLEPSLPAALGAIITQALGKDPEERPSLVQLSAVLEMPIATGPLPDRGATVPDVATAATTARTTVTPPAPAPVPPVVGTTTLGGAASSVDIQRRLGSPRRTRIIAASVLAAAAGAAATIALSPKRPAPVAAPTPSSGAVPAVAAKRTTPATPAQPVPSPPPAPAPTAFAPPVVAQSGNGPRPAATPRPRSGVKKATNPDAGAPVETESPAPTSYRGSKLKIETEFPAP